jgi:hypothetical protein
LSHVDLWCLEAIPDDSQASRCASYPRDVPPVRLKASCRRACSEPLC